MSILHLLTAGLVLIVPIAACMVALVAMGEW